MMDLISLGLVLAFREPGCPICRLRTETVERYLFNLLYENVNDGTTRLHLVRSQGFCANHAWRLQAIEHSNWHDGMGVGIIYEDLTSRVLNTLCDYLARPSQPLGRVTAFLRRHIVSRRTRLKGYGRLGRWLAGRVPEPAQWLLARLALAERCWVCEMADQSEEGYLTWLARQITAAEFRARYAASDGLCLPHLRRALAHAEDEEAARWLVQIAVEKMQPLVLDLREYGRKHAWHFRDEPKHPWEQASWIRAVAFLAGEPDNTLDESVRQTRAQAAITYRSRPASINQGSAIGMV